MRELNSFEVNEVAAGWAWDDVVYNFTSGTVNNAITALAADMAESAGAFGAPFLAGTISVVSYLCADTVKGVYNDFMV